MKQEMSGWQWHQLDHIKSFAPRSRQITTPAPITQFLQVGCSFWRPTNSVRALKISVIAWQANFYAMLHWKCKKSRAIVVKHSVVFCFLSIHVQVFAGKIVQVELLCLGLQPELREQRRQAGTARGRAGGTRWRRAGSSSGRGRRQSQGPQPRKHGSARGRQHRSRRRRRHRCPAWVRQQRLMWFSELWYLVWLLVWPTCPSPFWRPFSRWTWFCWFPVSFLHPLVLKKNPPPLQ